MPYKSRMQQRYFHYLESKGKMPKKTVKEFDDATDFEHLPEEAPGYARGGMIDEHESPDEEQGEMGEFVSSGEPNTEDHMEDEEPMEYMSKGGKVRRSDFAKALRRGY